MTKKMAKRAFEPGHRIMVRKGLHENDTIAFVGVLIPTFPPLADKTHVPSENFLILHLTAP